jgi:hypothetical protein
MSILAKQSEKSFRGSTRYRAADIKARKTYFATKHDETIPFDAQMAMAEAAEASIVILDCGHSPFLKKETAAILLEELQNVASQPGVIEATV